MGKSRAPACAIRTWPAPTPAEATGQQGVQVDPDRALGPPAQQLPTLSSQGQELLRPVSLTDTPPPRTRVAERDVRSRPAAAVGTSDEQVGALPAHEDVAAGAAISHHR